MTNDSTCSHAADAVLTLGNHHQLFLDDHLIEQSSGIIRRVNPVAKHPANPVIRPVEPWEPSGYVCYGSVLYDAQDRLYKCWASGRCLTLNGQASVAKHLTRHADTVSYFTSTDGLRWDRPKLGIIHNGEHDTNICALMHTVPDPRAWPYAQEPLAVIKDMHEPDAARRYKLAYLYVAHNYQGGDHDPVDADQLRAIAWAYSPDGTHWHDPQRYVTRVNIDGCAQIMRDPATNQWVMYGRTRYVAPATLAAFGSQADWAKRHKGRAANRAQSPDLIHWTPDHWADPDIPICMAVDPQDGPYAEIYRMHVFPYEGLYIGLVQMFWNSPAGTTLDVQLAVSRDGRDFQRVSDRTPFIPTGNVGDWDRFNITPTTNDPLPMGDELWFYYDGRNDRHGGEYRGADNGQDLAPFTSGIGVGSIKRDRFVAMEADFSGGRLVTRPLMAPDGRLFINAAAPFGRIRVTCLDRSGNPLGNAELAGFDSIRQPVPIQLPPGQPVKIVFELCNARLYSFFFSC